MKTERPIYVLAISGALADPYRTALGGAGKFRFADGDFGDVDLVIPRADLARYEVFARGGNTKEPTAWQAVREASAREFLRAMRSVMSVSYKVDEIDSAKKYGAGLTMTVADVATCAEKHKLPVGSEASAMDVALALKNHEKYGGGGRTIKVVLCNQFDRLLPISCQEHGIEFIDIPQPRYASRYQGVITAYVGDNAFKDASNQGDFTICPNAFQRFDEWKGEMVDFGQFVNNEYAVITNATNQATLLGRFDGKNVVALQQRVKVFGAVAPHGVRQKCFTDALVRPQVDRTVIVEGFAGTGKTLLALAGAYEARREGYVKNIIVFHPNTAVADKEGFLPGGWVGKTDHYHKSLYQKIAKIAEMRKDERGYAKVMSLDTVEVGRALANDVNGPYYLTTDIINDERGTEYENTFIIVDEAQNLTPKQLKTVMTRAGNGCITVVLGDVTQHDLEKNDEFHNGLMQAIVKLHGADNITILRLLEVKDVLRSRNSQVIAERWS